MPEARTPASISGKWRRTKNAKSPAYPLGYAHAQNLHIGYRRYLYICHPEGEVISIFKIKLIATIYYNCQEKTIQDHATCIKYSFYVQTNSLRVQICSISPLSRSRARCFLRESPAGSVPLQRPHFPGGPSISAFLRYAHLAANLALSARKFVRESYAREGYRYYL